MSVLVVIPSYGRADRLPAVFRNAADHSANSTDVLLVVEADDTESVQVCEQFALPHLVNTGARSYAGAINCAAETLEHDWLFTAADDLDFRRGWDVNALRLAELTGAKVIGTNDLHHQGVLAGVHSTHSLVAADYIADGATADAIPGKVLHDYHHNYVDTELVQVAMRRGVYAHCHTSIVEHRHPLWGLAEHDATYDLSASRYAEDAAEFERRMAAL